MAAVNPPTLTPFRLDGDYLSQALANVRTRPVSWASFVKASYIEQQHADVLKSLTNLNEQDDPRVRAEAIARDVRLYAKVLMESLLALAKPAAPAADNDLTTIILTFIYDGLTFIGNETPENTLHYQLAALYPDTAYTPFLQLLKDDASEDRLASILSAYVLTVLLTTATPPSSAAKTTPAASLLLEYIEKTLLSSSNTQFQFLGLQLLKELLSVKWLRSIYTNSPSFTAELDSLLAIMLNKNIELQMRYLSIYCLWTLSFDVNINSLLVNSSKYSEIIPALFNFANDAVKEKVVRLSISILINILNISSSSSSSKLLVIKKYLLANGLQIVKNLIDRKWSDEDLKDDLNALYEILNESIKSLTNFDEYENEIRTKHLIWSPCHKNQEFWFDNIGKFKENNWSLVKNLIALLSTSPSISTDQLYLNQSIVCYDLSMIIKIEPDVIKLVNNLGIKTKIMTLMNSPNSNVKFEALRTTQLLVANSL